MKKLALLLVICLLLCSCAGGQEGEFEESRSVTVSETTETPWSTTEKRTEPVVTERSAFPGTEATVDELVLTPIASDKSFDAMECRIYSISMTEPKREFYNKDMLALAKEICLSDEHVQSEIQRYNESDPRSRIESADDIKLISSGYSDFDMDGEYEDLLLLKYTGWGPGGGFLVYIDGDNYAILENDTNTDLKVRHIESNTYSFLMTETTQSASSYQNNIYSFENGIPEKVFDIEGASHAYRYKNGVFYCEIKNDDMVYPFALCTDGVFRQLACENIAPEDFETHINGGKEYLDSIAESGDEIKEIYTYGYYSYRLYGNDCCYMLTEADGILEETKYQLSDNFPDSYTPFEFTKELIYDADVHAVREISYFDPDIGGGYTVYAVKKDNDDAVLYAADENGVTDSMELLSGDVIYLLDRYEFYSRYAHMGFYDFDAPPCFALPRTGWGLTYDTYFIVDGKFCQGEWYLDGEKQDGVDYTMLTCFGTGSNEFVSYSSPSYNMDYVLEPLIRRVFTFDRENLRFEGYSEPYPEPTGYAAIAADVFKSHGKFVGGLYDYDGSNFGEPIEDNPYYCRYEKEGFRTKEEVMERLREYCTESMAEQFYSYYIYDTGDLMEYDGYICQSDGAPGHYESIKYIDSAEEKNGVITARVYSYTIGQDIPHDINPSMYARIVQEDGVWKLDSFPLKGL
ncbi:MAG: hypothetical protein J1F11_04260 [Oscillospiraceae bacterium]|nr:hypothetical protein [Oscillospiraceae bacterium]